MKKKILLILALSLGLSACSKEEYISQRHPEENKQSSPVSAKIDFKEKKSNDNFSNASLKNIDQNEDNKDDEKLNKEVKKDKKKKNDEEENPQEAYGIFTVVDISNIRREMNTDSEIVATIQPGTQIERSEIVGEWSKVSYGEYEGYILTELLEDVQ
ncbi:SH3 domain-containing protein [Anaerococcus rubeinfantis]|uniref:SH3 domain-containing protein n=1 Tax=Anaerococcus rubeinfantis TaxID=1720199 RepID=UPI00073E77A7|nr:SH3 domain-containing protein [Anaerococcus rubeinfantis]